MTTKFLNDSVQDDSGKNGWYSGNSQSEKPGIAPQSGISLGWQQAPQGMYPEAAPAAQPNAYADPVAGEPLYPDGDAKLARFEKHGYKDVWAAVIFLIVLLFTVIYGIVNAATYKVIKEEHKHDDGTDSFESKLFKYSSVELVFILLLTFGVSVVVSFLLLALMSCMPKVMIIVGNVFNILCAVAVAILSFIEGQVWMGILFLILAALSALWLFLVRGRIPFSAELLRAACKVLMANKMIYVINFCLAVLYYGIMVLWCFAMLRPVDRISNNVDDGFDKFCAVFLVLVFFWISQVMPNLMHVTTSGVVATWYFAGTSNMPSMPAVRSFVRSVTTSFGSICFGSLIVAIIQFLRFLVESCMRDSNDFLRCIVSCLLQCLERLVEYFNNYALIHVAIYGCGYIEAAKRTFHLCKQCFFAAYFNDALIAPTINMLTFVIGVLLGVLVGLIFWSWPVGVAAALVALVVISLILSTVTSAVSTIFVCFAEVPDGLQASDPQLYDTIRALDAGETNNGAA